MINLFILLVWIQSSFLEIPEYIVEYHQIKTKEEELNFIEAYRDSENISLQGYVISLEMKQAKYMFSPIKKYSTFNRSRTRIENLILKNPNNVDLRYIRLVIQENVPLVLGYKSSIKEDKVFLIAKMKVNDRSDYLDAYIKKNTTL